MREERELTSVQSKADTVLEHSTSIDGSNEEKLRKRKSRKADEENSTSNTSP